ncbi:MAG: hypothetical protein GX187_04730 [Clostridiaceae bacterium]|nr:hypothetical protein [Clostridiaceae bacterium]
MLNRLIAIKDAVINKFGALLGYTFLIIGGLITISLAGFFIRMLFKVFLTLLILALIVFGIYKVYEWYKS